MSDSKWRNAMAFSKPIRSTNSSFGRNASHFLGNCRQIGIMQISKKQQQQRQQQHLVNLVIIYNGKCDSVQVLKCLSTLVAQIFMTIFY